MIKKFTKCVALLLTVASAKVALEPVEKRDTEDHVQVGVTGTGLDWFLFSLGFVLGSTVEVGTNLGGTDWGGKAVQCIGQSSDLIESLYFTYFYIRSFIEQGGNQYVTYLSVYITRGVNAVIDGPCWTFPSLNRNGPSEGEIEAETLIKKNALKQALTSDVTDE